MSQPIRTAPLAADRQQAWDTYVDAHPAGTFFHRSDWQRAMKDGFGHDCHFIEARRGDEVTGVLPLVQVKSPLFGHALISTGFCVDGGPLVSDDDSLAALLDAAEAIAGELGAERIEFRAPAPDRDGWVDAGGTYVGFRRELESDPDANLARIRRKQRAMVRKGLGFGLTAVIDPGIDRFYEIYAASVHRLGTPVFGKGYFRALQETFAGDCDVLTIEHEQRPVASVLSFYHKGTVLPYYGGSLPEARDLAANDVMYHELMRHAVVSRGCTMFDFGRSKKDTGAYNFKRHWGFEPEELTYGFWMKDGGTPPEINPLNPKYRIFINMWQKMPFWLTKIVGPPIARQLG
ncbi:MAG: FemAB family PEP-CTERM system-associated protein [Geminicoccaceae bacterium]|nr:FemAB family PEP-CTERM system-associated protein [Geminicoccaceae bacterium]